MPFLDTLVTPQDDGTLTTSGYRKSTKTDLYHHWDSHHNWSCKYSVNNILTHMAKAVCSNIKLFEEELKHLHEVLYQCKYPKWAINKVWRQQEHRRTRNRRNTSLTQKRCHIVLPYTKDLCEIYKTICSSMESRYTSMAGTLKRSIDVPKAQRIHHKTE